MNTPITIPVKLSFGGTGRVIFPAQGRGLPRTLGRGEAGWTVLTAASMEEAIAFAVENIACLCPNQVPEIRAALTARGHRTIPGGWSM